MAILIDKKMFLVDELQLNGYLINDFVDGWLNEYSCDADEKLVCQRWLRETPAKRFVFNELYGDLLEQQSRLKVLDIGGGMTGLSRVLAHRHDYVLVDLLAHDDTETAGAMMRDTGADFIRAQDWASYQPETYDLVIANDLFPNVDQRLEMFLQRFLPRTNRLRLSLTYYDNPRYYLTRRVDADEFLCMLAWDGEHLESVLKKYSDNIIAANFDVFSHPVSSVYPNGRQVCLVEFKGYTADNGK